MPTQFQRRVQKVGKRARKRAEKAPHTTPGALVNLLPHLPAAVREELVAARFDWLIGSDPASDQDKNFFERHPERQYRLRLASPAEIEINAMHGRDPTLPPGMRHFAAVKQVAPGLRIKVYLRGLEDAVLEQSEWHAELAFEATAGARARQLEERMRAAAAKRGRQ
jgi:hypothetical protein